MSGVFIKEEIKDADESEAATPFNLSAEAR